MHPHWHHWNTLSPDQLYAFLKLRSDVFVVEQNCVFSEMDGIDDRCEHLLCFDNFGVLASYLRLVPPGCRRPHSPSPAAPGPALGRLVVRDCFRGSGLGRRTMLWGLAACGQRYPGQPVSLSAQHHLQPFYESLGFEAIGQPYREDGILHVDMRRPAILAV